MRATREEQRIEALRRLRVWEADEFIVETFNNGGLAVCEKFNSLITERFVILECELPQNILSRAREIEEEYGLLVYTTIKTETEFGKLYDLLYVCKDKEDWELDDEIMEDKIAMSYCINITIPEFSEFGTIGIDNMGGCLYRIY